MSCRCLAVLVGLLSLLPVNSSAAGVAPLPDEITIDDALRILRDESPRWAAERVQLHRAEADVIQAGLWSNPSLSYGLLQLAQGANTGAAATHQLTLELPLLLFGQRGKRLEAARSAQAVAHAELAARFVERAREVHHAFVELLGAQEKLGLLTESQQEVQRAETIVRGRAAAGDRSQYDVLRIVLEARALNSEIAAAEAERLDAAGKLCQLLGRPGWSPRARGSLAPIEPSQARELLWERVRAEHPALEAARRRIRQRDAALAQAKRERWPEIALQVGLLATQAEDSLSFFGGLTTPLPLWNRQQGVVAHARAERLIADREHRAELAETEAALQRATAVSRSRHAAAARLAADVFAHLPELRRMAEEVYRQGKSGIVDLLDAFRGLKTLRMQYVEQLVSAKQAEVELLYAAGSSGSASIGSPIP